MRLSRSFRGGFRLLGFGALAAGVIVVVIAVTSAGPAAKPASAQVTACTPGTTVQTASGPVCGTTATNAAILFEYCQRRFASSIGAHEWFMV